MAIRLEAIGCWLFGSVETLVNWGAARPFDTKNITTDEKLIEMLDKITREQSVIIALLDPFHEEKELCLALLETSPSVHRVLVTYDGLPEDLFSQQKFTRLSLSRVVTHIMYDLGYLYSNLALHYSKSNQKEWQAIIQNKIKLNVEWILSESKFEIPHILLISLNTEQTNVLSAQAALLDLCSRTPYRSNIMIKTLQELTDLNDDDNGDQERRRTVTKIGLAVQDIATSDYGPPIILFLVGNLEKIYDSYGLNILADVIKKAQTSSTENKCFSQLIAHGEINNTGAKQWIDEMIPENTMGLSYDQIIPISLIRENQEFNDALAKAFCGFDERSRISSVQYWYNIVQSMKNDDDAAESGHRVNAPYESRRIPVNVDQIIAHSIAFEQGN